MAEIPTPSKARKTYIDLGLFSVVASFLLISHFFLESFLWELQFHHGNVFLHALSLSYIHVSASHLLGNVAGFSLVTLTAYAVCLRIDRRRWFRLNALTMLFVLPIIVGIMGIYVLDPNSVFVGFSSVISGLTALLLVSVAIFTVDRYGLRTGSVMGGLFVLLLAVVYFGTYVIGGPDGIAGPAIASSVVSVSWYVSRRRSTATPASTPFPVRDDTLVSIGVLVLAVSSIRLFSLSTLSFDFVRHGVPLLIGAALVTLIPLVD